jgi:hypothetical protein
MLSSCGWDLASGIKLVLILRVAWDLDTRGVVDLACPRPRDLAVLLLEEPQVSGVPVVALGD